MYQVQGAYFKQKIVQMNQESVMRLSNKKYNKIHSLNYKFNTKTSKLMVHYNKPYKNCKNNKREELKTFN